ncbi:uncharacterized protein IL334_001435 [Kwoniella shivajii]|uniref:F-box domain-containing protein n=1 Tax=Kwoniella shivajii TaxID=564305 RepID=A0ABZ1CS32_9TREE|nr:hypothetical protein IL334_001435 [Kwoniella shivajii]
MLSMPTTDVIREILPLPFSAEIQSRIYDLLVPEIPFKLMLLSHRHYGSIVPSLYTHITLSGQNADRFNERIHCTMQKDAVGKRMKWVGRKSKACTNTQSLVISDDACLMSIDHLVQSSLRRPLKHHDQACWSDTLFPNLKKVVLRYSTMNLLTSEFMANLFGGRMQSLEKCIGNVKIIHVDVSSGEFEKIHLKILIQMIKDNFTKAESVIFRMKWGLLPIPPQWIRSIPLLKMYLEEKEETDEGLVARTNLRMFNIMYRYGNDQIPREKPLEVYFRNEELVQDYNNRMLNRRGIDNMLSIRQWQEEDDWMK